MRSCTYNFTFWQLYVYLGAYIYIMIVQFTHLFTLYFVTPQSLNIFYI